MEQLKWGWRLKLMAKETEVEDKGEGNDAGSAAKCNTTTEGELDEVGVNNGNAQYCGIFPPKGPRALGICGSQQRNPPLVMMSRHSGSSVKPHSTSQ